MVKVGLIYFFVSPPTHTDEAKLLNRSDRKAQSRQSAKPFLQSSELGLPQPLTRSRVCPLVPAGGGGAHYGERGGGRVPIPTRGHTQWYSAYMYMYFVQKAYSQDLANKRMIFRLKNKKTKAKPAKILIKFQISIRSTIVWKV